MITYEMADDKQTLDSVFLFNATHLVNSVIIYKLICFVTCR